MADDGVHGDFGVVAFDRNGDLGRAVRELMVNPLFHHIFPDCRLKYGGAGSLRIQTETSAELFFTGVDGSLTGRGGDAILIDDPIK